MAEETRDNTQNEQLNTANQPGALYEPRGTTDPRADELNFVEDPQPITDNAIDNSHVDTAAERNAE